MLCGDNCRMKSVLFTWELGAGHGHTTRMIPFVSLCLEQGYKVSLAVKDLRTAANDFAAQKHIEYFQAPAKPTGRGPFPRAANFSQLLANVGFDSAESLYARMRAWRSIYDCVQPDLVVFDHSPVAMLAMRGLDVKSLLIGTGFEIPPDVAPFPLLRSGIATPAELISLERFILSQINSGVEKIGVEGIERLSQIYEADLSFLASVPLLDPYSQYRSKPNYVGPLQPLQSRSAVWPNVKNGQRCYVYLKAAPCIPAILDTLTQVGASAVVCFDGESRALKRKFESNSVRVSSELLNLESTMRECDFAILNGGHGTTAEALLAGNRCLFLPLSL